MAVKDQTPTGVLGAHGAQGSAILRALAHRGIRTRGLIRRPGVTERGQEYLRADLGDRDELRAAFHGLSALCFTMPLIYDGDQTRRYAENVAEAAVRAGVERVVFNTNTRIPQSPTEVAGFETRRAAEEILRNCGIPVAIVRPTVYFENLLAPPVARAVNENGVLPYPVPEDTPIAWISLRDLGAAVAAVMAQDDFTDAIFDIGGVDLTGAELSGRLGRGTGQEVSFVSLDPSKFEAGLATDLGSDAARGVAGLYHWLSAHLDTALMSGGTAVLTQLGIEPITITDWATASWPEPRTA